MTARPALRSFLARAGWQGMSGSWFFASTNTRPDMPAVRPAISPAHEPLEVTGAACAAPLTSTMLPASLRLAPQPPPVSERSCALSAAGALRAWDW